MAGLPDEGSQQEARQPAHQHPLVPEASKLQQHRQSHPQQEHQDGAHTLAGLKQKPQQHRQTQGGASQKPAPPVKQKAGFFQGGLDALVSGISVIGDTLGQVLEDSIEQVAVAATASNILLGAESPPPKQQPRPVRKPVAPNAAAHPLGADSAAGVSGSNSARAGGASSRGTALGVGNGVPRAISTAVARGKEEALAAAGDKAAVPKDTQLIASRNVANAMAVRAKQLQADLRAARKEVAQLQARCGLLEEENLRLKAELAEGLGSMEVTEAEDLLREQVEHLLAEKSQMSRSNRELQRENEQLHQILAYYEHMHVQGTGAQEDQFSSSGAATQKTAWDVVSPLSSDVAVGLDNLSSTSLSPLDTPLGSQSDLGAYAAGHAPGGPADARSAGDEMVSADSGLTVGRTESCEKDEDVKPLWGDAEASKPLVGGTESDDKREHIKSAVGERENNEKQDSKLTMGTEFCEPWEDTKPVLGSTQPVQLEEDMELGVGRTDSFALQEDVKRHVGERQPNESQGDITSAVAITTLEVSQPELSFLDSADSNINGAKGEPAPRHEVGRVELKKREEGTKLSQVQAGTIAQEQQPLNEVVD